MRTLKRWLNRLDRNQKVAGAVAAVVATVLLTGLVVDVVRDKAASRAAAAEDGRRVVATKRFCGSLQAAIQADDTAAAMRLIRSVVGTDTLDKPRQEHIDWLDAGGGDGTTSLEEDSEVTPLAVQTSCENFEESQLSPTALQAKKAKEAQDMKDWEAAMERWRRTPTGRCVEGAAGLIEQYRQHGQMNDFDVLRAGSENTRIALEVLGELIRGEHQDKGYATSLERRCIEAYGGTGEPRLGQVPATTSTSETGCRGNSDPDCEGVPDFEEDTTAEAEPEQVLSKAEWCRSFNTAYRKDSSGMRDQTGLNQIITMFASDDLRRADLGGELQSLVDSVTSAADDYEVQAESDEVRQIAEICRGL